MPQTADDPAAAHDGRPVHDADVLGVLMAPFTGTAVPPFLQEALDRGLASVILFGHNTPDPRTARDLARAVHARSEEIGRAHV